MPITVTLADYVRVQGDPGWGRYERDGAAYLFDEAFRALNVHGGGTLVIPQPGWSPDPPGQRGAANLDPGRDETGWTLRAAVAATLEHDVVVAGEGNPLIRVVRRGGQQVFTLYTGSTFLQMRGFTLDVAGATGRGIHCSVREVPRLNMPTDGRVQLKGVRVLNAHYDQNRDDASAAALFLAGPYAMVEVLDCTIDGVTTTEGSEARGVQVNHHGGQYCRRTVVRGGSISNVRHASHLVGNPDEVVINVDGIYVNSAVAGPVECSVEISGVQFRECQGRSLKVLATAFGVSGCTFHRTQQDGHVEVDAQWGVLTATGNRFFYRGYAPKSVINVSGRRGRPDVALVATGNLISYDPRRDGGGEVLLDSTPFQAWFDRREDEPDDAPIDDLPHVVMKGNLVRGVCEYFASFQSPDGGMFDINGNSVDECRGGVRRPQAGGTGRDLGVHWHRHQQHQLFEGRAGRRLAGRQHPVRVRRVGRQPQHR